MRRAFVASAFLMALAIASIPLAAVPQTLPGSLVLHASAADFNLNYSDPSSDVFKLWTSNDSHVTDSAGYWIMSPSPGTVNLLRLSSADASGNVAVYLRVQTAISVLANTTYEWHLYPRADNSTHYVLTFRNGGTSLVSNRTGSATVNLTANTSVGNQGWLEVRVPKADLGGAANITAWNMDAVAKQIQGDYTYEDFVWQQPGNPGSAPAFIQGRVTDEANGAGLANANVSTGSAGYVSMTNATGYYSLPAAPGNFTLTFSLPGYATVTRAVTVQYQQTQTVNVQLSRSDALAQALPWIALAVVVVAAAAVAFLILRRRKRRAPQ